MSAIEKRYTGKKREVQGWFSTHTEYQCVLTDLSTSATRIFWERAHRGNTLPWIISTFRRNKGEPIMSRTDPRPGPTDPTADQRCPKNQFVPRVSGCNADPQTCGVHSSHAKEVQRRLAAFNAERAELERRVEIPAPVVQLYIWRPSMQILNHTIVVAATSLKEATQAANEMVAKAGTGFDGGNYYGWPDHYQHPIVAQVGTAVGLEF
jgi:hypothetical protein